MQEVIQKVIATEREAKQLVESARAEANQVIANARLQARRLVDDARREAQADVERLLTQAEAEAVQAKSEQLARIAEEIEKTIRLDPIITKQVVDAAMRCVCGIPQKEVKS